MGNQVFTTFYKELNPKEEKQITDITLYILSGGAQGTTVRNAHSFFDTVLKLTRLVNPATKLTLTEEVMIKSIMTELRIDSKENFQTSMNKVKQLKKNYIHYEIPKASGGTRPIDEPPEELKSIQRQIQNVLRNGLKILPHDNAHAYEVGRSILTNAQRHKESNYFCRVDFHNFFGSISNTMILRELLKLRNILKISLVSEEYLDWFLQFVTEAATLKSVLPQGSPLSPYLSNILMTGFDHALTETAIEIYKDTKNIIVITRYADDVTISSRQDLALMSLSPKYSCEQMVGQAIEKAGLKPFIRINEKKTICSDKNHKNWITGLKINNDNEITIGHENKTELKRRIGAILCSKTPVASEEIYSVIGMLSHLHNIEPEYNDYLQKAYQRKFKLIKPLIQSLIDKGNTPDIIEYMFDDFSSVPTGND